MTWSGIDNLWYDLITNGSALMKFEILGKAKILVVFDKYYLSPFVFSLDTNKIKKKEIEITTMII